MLDWKRLSVRYGRMTYPQRLGNLASTLARTTAVTQSKNSATSVPDLLREGMWIIEWSAPDATPDALAELAPMQKVIYGTLIKTHCQIHLSKLARIVYVR